MAEEKIEKGIISEEALEEIAGGIGISKETLKKVAIGSGVIISAVGTVGGAAVGGYLLGKKRGEKKASSFTNPTDSDNIELTNHQKDSEDEKIIIN